VEDQDIGTAEWINTFFSDCARFFSRIVRFQRRNRVKKILRIFEFLNVFAARVIPFAPKTGSKISNNSML